VIREKDLETKSDSTQAAVPSYFLTGNGKNIFRCSLLHFQINAFFGEEQVILWDMGR
jgi:hypothetical protein